MSTAERRRLQWALRLLGADPAAADPLSRADALWLMRVLPDAGQAPDEDAHEDDAVARKKTPSGPAAAPSTATAPAPATDPGSATTNAADATRHADETTSLFVQQPGAGDEPQLHARRIPVPAAEALPGRAAFERALRPFLRRRPSRTRRAVDPEATAEASAQASANALLAAGPGRAVPAVVPVLRAVPERWFDLVLLAEQDDTMRVFEDTLRELRQLLARHGAFRRVGLWRWSMRDGKLHTQTSSGMACAPHAMLQSQHPQLVWVLTHGASTRWNEDPLRQYVRGLADRAVVAIVQLLPEPSWGATTLGATRDQVRSRERASVNGQLLRREAWTGAWLRDGATDAVPMLSLRDESVAKWAEFVMSPRTLVHAAIDLERRPAPRRPRAVNAPVPADPHAQVRDRVLRFRAIASPEAFALLRLLAGAWITLPVMRLLLQSMPGARRVTAMAEVLLSGLLRRTSDADVRVEELTFDFQPGVREWLAGSLSSDERRALDAAMADSRQAIRRFVECRLNRTFASFGALLLDPEGTELLPASAKSFVEVSRRLRGLRHPPASVPAAPPAIAEPVAAPATPMPTPTPGRARPRTTRRVRVLHLSNLYIGRDGDWRSRPELGSAWHENLREIDLETPVDIVCFTGDVANSGKRAQYEEATRFVEDMLETLRLPRQRFFCVPGNHDIDRSVRRNYYKASLASGTQPLDGETTIRELLERQAAFREWQANLSQVRPDGRLGYLRRIDLGEGHSLNVVGLDSAWLDLDDGHGPRLGDSQLRDVHAHGLGECATIAMIHHSIAQLEDGDRVEHHLAGIGVELLMTGHLHATNLAHAGWSKRGLLVATTGSLFDEPEVQVIDLDLHPGKDDEPDRAEIVGVVTRAWVNDRWMTARREDTQPAEPLPASSSASVETEEPHFFQRLIVGRDEHIDRMDGVLMAPKRGGRGPVVLTGERGIGKTALALEFHRRYWLPTRATPPGGQSILTFNAAELHARVRREEDLGALIADGLGIPTHPATVWEDVQEELERHPRLMLFEDVDDRPMQSLVGALSIYIGFFPVIVTTNGRSWPIQTWTVIQLERLTFPESCEFLVAESTRTIGKPLAPADVQELADMCGGLPADLQAALAGTIRGLSPQEVRQHLRQRHEDAEQREASSERAAGPARPDDPGKPVRTVFLAASPSELADHHDMLGHILLERGIHATGTEDFRASDLPLLLRLNEEIRERDAVVQLRTPDDFGSNEPLAGDVELLLQRCPDFAARLPRLVSKASGELLRMTWRQWEAWLALYHRKRLLVVLMVPFASDEWSASPSGDQATVLSEAAHVFLLGEDGLARVEQVVQGSSAIHELESRVSVWLQATDAATDDAPPRAAAAPLRPTIFLSYAREDVKAVRRLVQGLREIGFDCVWFDIAEVLSVGESMASLIDSAMRSCDYFMPVLSRAADARVGKFRDEWRRGIERARQLSGRTFLLPTVIDKALPRRTTYRRIFSDETAAFGELQALHAPGGQVSDKSAAQLAPLLGVPQGSA